MEASDIVDSFLDLVLLMGVVKLGTHEESDHGDNSTIRDNQSAALMGYWSVLTPVS